MIEKSTALRWMAYVVVISLLCMGVPLIYDENVHCNAAGAVSPGVCWMGENAPYLGVSLIGAVTLIAVVWYFISRHPVQEDDGNNGL